MLIETHNVGTKWHLCDTVHASRVNELTRRENLTQTTLQESKVSSRRKIDIIKKNRFCNTLHSLKVSSTLGKSGRDKNAKLTDLVWKVSMFVSWPFFLNGGIYSPWSSWARYGDPGDKAQSTLGTDEKMLQVVTSVVLLHAGRREK